MTIAGLCSYAFGSTDINGGAVTTTGAQSYGDAVTLGVRAILGSTSGGAIAFASAITGASALTIKKEGG